MKPLAGIRVIEAAQMISAPMAGAVMAEQGADVVKVELADGIGDRLRVIGSRRNGIGAMFNGINHGKRSISLDTKTEQGLQVLLELCASADVFIQNFRPGAAERMGVGYQHVKELNPNLIYVSVSGFGPSGPKSEQKVYDYVIQAMTGMADLQKGSGDEPKLIRQFAVDKVTALTVSQAITAALFARERGQGAQHVQLSMLDVGLWFFWPDGMMDKSLLGDDANHAPHFSDLYDVKKTSDGYIALVASGSRSWPNLCKAFNVQWLNDPRFATEDAREQNGHELSEEFDRFIAKMSTADALAAMSANDVPGAAVAARGDVLSDPQVIHNESVVRLSDGPVGERMEALPPIRFGDGADLAVPAAAPGLGQHSDEILAELGYDEEQIADLRSNGVLGPV